MQKKGETFRLWCPGMPSVFARAFLFKNALDQIKDPAQANSGLASTTNRSLKSGVD